ncbi:unnamed protein product [Larinioides sclopetarius]|uniref:Ribosomal protein S18 n=1 Tax=Larinioides sclopetarius TaxID=280406 RepID=A0AAV1Z4L1_9ARAC
MPLQQIRVTPADRKNTNEKEKVKYDSKLEPFSNRYFQIRPNHVSLVSRRYRGNLLSSVKKQKENRVGATKSQKNI